MSIKWGSVVKGVVTIGAAYATGGASLAVQAALEAKKQDDQRHAINKQNDAINEQIKLANSGQLQTAQAYALADQKGSSLLPKSNFLFPSEGDGGSSCAICRYIPFLIMGAGLFFLVKRFR